MPAGTCLTKLPVILGLPADATHLECDVPGFIALTEVLVLVGADRRPLTGGKPSPVTTGKALG